MIVFLSSIKINIKRLNVIYNNFGNDKIFINDFEVDVGIYILNFIKIFNIKIKNDEIVFLFFHIKYDFLKRINILKNQNILKLEKIYNNRKLISFRELKPNINKIYMNVSFSTKSNRITTFITPVISSAIAILISNCTTKNVKKEKIYFKVFPEYKKINGINIKLNSEIYFYIIDILDFIITYKKILKINNVN